jgi:hypothetical protein
MGVLKWWGVHMPIAYHRKQQVECWIGGTERNLQRVEIRLQQFMLQMNWQMVLGDVVVPGLPSVVGLVLVPVFLVRGWKLLYLRL